MPSADFERGQLIGKVDALEKMMVHHKERMDSHAARLRLLERMQYVLLGGLAVLQLLPMLGKILELFK